MSGVGAALFAALVISSVLPESNASCGDSSLGGTECVLLTPYYYEYQWATCLTNEYISLISDNSHHCRNSAQICWYQCQLELNNRESGPVNENCLCSSASTLPTPNEDLPTLAPYCFSPDGNDCSWYRECLEMRYPCEGTEGGYAIEYAERYCNLFSDNNNEFAQSGIMWIDGVRKCLQVALVPSLRPWISKTCADIKQDAFDSHPRCYVTPGSGAPSICDLSCSDIWSIFWVVNVIGDAITTAPIETGREMLGVIKGCFGTLSTLDCPINVTALLFTISRLEVWYDTSLFARVVTAISSFIADFVNLDESEIGWFPYYDEESSDNRRRRNTKDSNKSGEFVMLLVDRSVLSTSNNRLSSNNQALDEAISVLSAAVGNEALSRIPVMLNGTTEVVFGVSSLGQCGDTFCSNNTNIIQLAIAPPESTAAAPNGTLKFNTTVVYICVSIIFTFILSYLP